MKPSDRIFVAGHRGLVGSSLVRALRRRGFDNLLLRTRQELDLTERTQVEEFFRENRPEYVFLAAAKVGGILANSMWPADFIRDNLAIEMNVIDASHQYDVEKLLFLGSSCIYPKHAPQPMKEEHLLTGPLEPTNEAYAVAKIAGIKMSQAYYEQYGSCFISVMPTNLYGPGDDFDLETSHVLPAVIRKFHEAKVNDEDAVMLWGTGTPRREFLHVDDLADACLFLMKNYESPEIINIGVGEDISISELGELVRDIVGFQGKIVWDKTKPDGTPQKLLDVSRIEELGWSASIMLRAGVRSTYEWYVKHEEEARTGVEQS